MEVRISNFDERIQEAKKLTDPAPEHRPKKNNSRPRLQQSKPSVTLRFNNPCIQSPFSHVLCMDRIKNKQNKDFGIKKKNFSNINSLLLDIFKSSNTTESRHGYVVTLHFLTMVGTY
jgi:hypothetical protein